MPREKTSDDERAAEKRETQAANDAGQAEVQERMDEALEQGYLGAVTDPTPNENYTVAGVTRGAPTPETDADLAMEARVRAGLVPTRGAARRVGGGEPAPRREAQPPAAGLSRPQVANAPEPKDK